METSDMLDRKYPFQLPALPYSYDALEPYIDEETMYYHHDKHFQTYINNLNGALEGYPALQDYTLRQLLLRPNGLPPAQRETISRNAGGVFNHDAFFRHLAPANAASHAPKGALLELIGRTYGSFEECKTLVSARAKAVFGSGWTQLCLTRQGRLRIVNLKDQETVLPGGMRPLILFDVWEHAYYLKYKNDRADYIQNLWNVVVFPEI